jgi:hypothetical protein
MGGKSMRKLEQVILTSFAAILIICFCSSVWNVNAFEVGPFDCSGFIRNQTYFRLSSPNDFMQSRNEMRLDLTYSKIPNTTFFLRLRPYYDSIYDWSDKGTGAHSRLLRDNWAHNFGRNQDREPLVREVYVDYTKDPFDIRLGKQIVSWGKSDGIYMLDVINPWCYRNPSEFVEEEVKIPLWMANFNYKFKPGTLQFLFIPEFIDAKYPGNILNEMGHDWQFNIATLGNTVYKALYDAFGVKVDREYPATTWGNSQWGARWSGFGKGISYTLNYFYTWTPILNDWPNTGDAATATVYKRRADRLEIYGFSLDRYFETGDFVLRLETAYTRGQPFVKPDTNLEEKDQIGYMLGWDRWVQLNWLDPWRKNAWLLSFQLWQNFIVNPNKRKNCYIDIGANEVDWNTGRITNGARDAIKTQLTAYLTHDGFFPGETGHFETLLLKNLDQGCWWWYSRFKYDYSDHIELCLGWNLYFGNEDDPLGQFRDNKNIWTEIRYSWH